MKQYKNELKKGTVRLFCTHGEWWLHCILLVCVCIYMLCFFAWLLLGKEVKS